MNDRTISSLLIALAYALALALTLIACGTSGGLSSVPPGSGDASSRLPASSGQPSGGGTSQSKAQGSAMTQGSAMAQAYQDALEDIYNKRVYPNGDLVDLLPDARMEENHFALFDVDGDGTTELLYRNDNSTMAGMVTNIYSFHEDTGKLYLELSGFVGMTFYDNGVIRVMASHNHGLSGRDDFWPFALYQYDTGGDGYLMTGYADGWEKETFPEDWDGNPFPDDVDQDGDGMIYLLTFGGQEVAATQLDGPDFEKWLDTYVAGAAELDIPWQDMTPENIQAITGLSFPY